jgi:phage FluMu protein Com
MRLFYNFVCVFKLLIIIVNVKVEQIKKKKYTHCLKMYAQKSIHAVSKKKCPCDVINPLLYRKTKVQDEMMVKINTW